MALNYSFTDNYFINKVFIYIFDIFKKKFINLIIKNVLSTIYIN